VDTPYITGKTPAVQRKTSQVLPQIVLLRALASLAVCFFHLACGNAALFPQANALKQVSGYGYLGVPMFFIISGFIICYAMPGNYGIRDFKTFAAKRIVRIDPPYLASIALTILLFCVSAPFNHYDFHFSAKNLLYHVSYLNNFNLGVYYSPVYWTLGIEFQFYLLIGLLFPYLARSETSVAAGILLLSLACFLPAGNFKVIVTYLPVFGAGIAAYFYLAAKTLRTPVYLFVQACCLALISLSGLPTLLTCLLTLHIIHYWRRHHRLIRFFSRISYSLYLTHTLIGGRCVNLGLRFCHSEGQRYLLFIAALLISIAFD